ncbi:MAG: lamin tail domain-containing protein [Patescibacteria group bacterium]
MPKRIVIMSDIKKIKPRGSKIEIFERNSRGAFRVFLTIQKQLLAGFLAVTLVLANAHAFVAFEAHVVDVKAEVARIDPPVVTPAGGEYIEPVDIIIDDSDTDATHIFYTLTFTADPFGAPDPVCGDTFGGPKPQGPLQVTQDTVIKAIACDGAGSDAHGSFVTTEIYTFPHTAGMVQGFKYHDVDRSGTLTPGDFPIAGWQIQIATSTFATSTVTNAQGYYSFAGLAPDIYTLEEESRDGWDYISPKTVNVVISGTETEAVDFFNAESAFMCSPKTINWTSGLAVQAAGAISENNDDIALASNVTINGDARSNDDIERTTGASNVAINGSATSTDQVDDGINVSEDILENASTANLPDVMISEWKARAADGGAIAGSFNFPNNTVGIQMGPTEIMGNVTFGSGNTLLVKGPIYIHGNLNIGSNTVITQDNGFGKKFVAIVVDGTVDIGSNVSFNGSIDGGAFLLISIKGAVAGDDAAIETASNNSDLGKVVLYASNGDIHVHSDRTIWAAFAAHGTGTDADANAAVRLDSNVTVDYSELPSEISCGPRQPFESTSHILINEFVPNPSGSDQGTAGGALDGEWVELFNPTNSSVDVASWWLYDASNANELEINGVRTNTGDTIIPSHGRLVVYRDGDGDFELNNSTGDTVRLFSGPVGSGGVLVDSHTYTAVAGDNKSFARIPDGSSNWIDPEGTPGEENNFFFTPDASVLFSDIAVIFLSRETLDLTPPEFSPVSEPTPASEAATIAPEEEKAKVEEPAVAIVEEAPVNNGDDGTPPTENTEVTETAETPEVSTPPAEITPEETPAPLVEAPAPEAPAPVAESPAPEVSTGETQ